MPQEKEKNPNAVALGRLGGTARAKALSREEIAEIGRRGGKVGGQARAAALSPAERRRIAQKAAARSVEVRRVKAKLRAQGKDGA
jgi:general stress protein YciG